HTAGAISDVAFGYGTSGSFTETMRVKGIGRVGIGTSTPAQTLDVVGVIHVSSLNGSATTLSTDASGNIIRTPSDARLKNNISPISNALSKVMKMHGVTYNFINAGRFGAGRQMGFLAQDLETIIPEAVSSGGEYKSVNYPVLTALLAEAIKEQQNEFNEMKKDKIQMQEHINKQQKQIDKFNKDKLQMRQQIDELKKMMEKLLNK